MADMMKYTGAINILRSDRILPRAWRLEIADMLETISTMEKYREISTLDDSSHVSSHSGDGVLHRSGSRSGDPGAGGGAGGTVAAVRDDGNPAGPAGTDGLMVREALVSLVRVVSNMRVPQNVADAAMQVAIVGSVLERAKAVLQETSPGAGPASANGLIARIARLINPQAFDEKYTMPKGRIREQQYALERAREVAALIAGSQR